MNEKIKDLTDKFQGELEGERSKYDALLQEKNELEMDFADQMKTTENKHAQATAATESSFQNKILNEIERYQALRGGEGRAQPRMGRAEHRTRRVA